MKEGKQRTLDKVSRAEGDVSWVFSRDFDFSVAEAISRVIFKKDETLKRKQICERIIDFYKKGGGKNSTIHHNDPKVISCIKSGLSKGKLGFASAEGHGFYEYIEPEEKSAGKKINISPAGADQGDKLQPIHPYGVSDLNSPEVYAWYLPQYGREKKETNWPIKIGFAESGFNRRVQDFKENIPETPVYLFRFGYMEIADARNLEKALHLILGEIAGRRVEKVYGKEWYKTNPQEIQKCVETITKLKPIYPQTNK